MRFHNNTTSFKPVKTENNVYENMDWKISWNLLRKFGVNLMCLYISVDLCTYAQGIECIFSW